MKRELRSRKHGKRVGISGRRCPGEQQLRHLEALRIKGHITNPTKLHHPDLKSTSMAKAFLLWAAPLKEKIN